MERQYARDGRAPIPEKEVTSRIMSAIKGKDTSPELKVRKALWRKGLRGYRLHYKKLAGKPDICFTRYRVAIFVHGCFWHRCPMCNLGIPKKHSEFWEQKFYRNVARDMANIERILASGWDVITVWECETKKDERIALKINEICHLLKVKKGN